MTPFSHRPGFLIAGFDLGQGRYTVTASDQVFDWELNHHVSHVNVGSLSPAYIPGPREIELTVRAQPLHMGEGPDLCSALAALMNVWVPPAPALRGQAGLMAVTQDLSR